MKEKPCHCDMGDKPVAPCDVPWGDDALVAFERFGPASQGCMIALCGLVAAVAMGWYPALWMQPTLVGIFWGSIFLAGIACADFGNGHLAVIFLAGGIATLATLGCIRLTEFPPSDCLLTTTLILAAAWFVSRLDRLTRPSSFQHSPRPETASMSGMVRRRPDSRLRFSIWDILFLTCVAACACSAYPGLETSPLLLASLWIAVLGGLISSWAACRWTWQDQWAPLQILSLGAMFGISAAIVILQSPMPIGRTVSWLLQGPFNVIAAQATTVLLFSGALRWDQYCRSNYGVRSAPATADRA
ncbi:hypothetical protein [Aureliella helgolandensis]|uniref:hypothetical protein n=1 Tax=Aureliella helgolandensis TaxID=2527968 RepID=UPI00119D99B9|nr:hypothetical protein [Aureliella helgolandensis]